MEANFAFQQSRSLNTQLLSGDGVKTVFPVLNTEDVI